MDEPNTKDVHRVVYFPRKYHKRGAVSDLFTQQRAAAGGPERGGGSRAA